MGSSSIVILALAATAWAGMSNARCGIEAVPQEDYNAIQRLQNVENDILSRQLSISKRGDLDVIKVPLYFHTVSSPGKETEITDEQLEAQYTLLRDIFTEYDIEFEYHGVASRTVDSYFASSPYPLNQMERSKFNEWRKSTRQGDYGSLNIYFYTDMADGFWGSCNIPKEWNNTESLGVNTFYEDACNIHAGTLPGTATPGVNLGYTSVHEVGHWFGLFHVFMAYLCGSNGDLIDDTPEQSTPTDGCPIGKDSCPDFPGVDSIHNFMDYSEDACLTEFTPGQKLRMHTSWTEFRANPSEKPI